MTNQYLEALEEIRRLLGKLSSSVFVDQNGEHDKACWKAWGIADNILRATPPPYECCAGPIDERGHKWHEMHCGGIVRIPGKVEPTTVLDDARQAVLENYRPPSFTPDPAFASQAPPVEPKAPLWPEGWPFVEDKPSANVARGMCQLANRPACDAYPRCQCGQTLPPGRQGPF